MFTNTNNIQDKRHIKIIKQLCNIINEEFVAITAGDYNNIYYRAWHFKTNRVYYYMIEKENIVTLYNGFTKEQVTQARLINNKIGKSFFSAFISKILT